MKEEKRKEGRRESAEEPMHKELQPLLWQAHVYEEMDRLARTHQPAPAITHFAEEYAEHAMRGVEMSPNEYQRAVERGEKLSSERVAGHLADASDIAGG